MIVFFGRGKGQLSGEEVRVRSLVLLILYFIILTIAVGCAVPPPAPQQALWSKKYIQVDPECSPVYECRFIVTVGPFNKDMELDVELHADQGVAFSSDEQIENKLSDAGRTSMVSDVYLQPHGTRSIRFPFTFNTEIALAGEYVVMVKLFDRGDDNKLIETLQIKAFVYMDKYGNPKLLRNPLEFNAEYKDHYTAGDGVHYTILLAPGKRQRLGKVVLRWAAPHNDYDPVLKLSSAGGVTFDSFAPVSICVNKGGSRIVVFPFQIIEEENQPDGRYVFSFSIEEETLSLHGILPIAVELISEVHTHRNQWLTLVYDIPASSLATLAATDGENGEDGYFQTISTGNVDQQCYSSASNDTTLPDDIDGDSPVSRSTREPANDPRCDNWQSLVSNEQPLSLSEVYQKYKIADMDMDMNRFVEEFRLCNSIGVEVNTVTFYPEETYYLPNDIER